MSDVQTLFSKDTHPSTGERLPAVWRDKKGVLHKAVGADLVGGWNREFCMWTACGSADVPANAAWLIRSIDKVDYPSCLADTPAATPDPKGE